MAVTDAKAYFKKMEAQRNEMKADLADFEQGLADGYITEEQLADIKADFDYVDTNYKRLAYIMYLLDIPNRTAKKNKYKGANRDLIEQFAITRSDEEAVILENENILDHFRTEIKRLKNSK